MPQRREWERGFARPGIVLPRQASAHRLPQQVGDGQPRILRPRGGQVNPVPGDSRAARSDDRHRVERGGYAVQRKQAVIGTEGHTQPYTEEGWCEEGSPARLHAQGLL